MVLDSYQDMQDIVRAIGQNVLIKTVFNPDK